MDCEQNGDYTPLKIFTYTQEFMDNDLQFNPNSNEGVISEITALFAQVGIISVLSEKERLQLAKKARMVTYSSGEFIVRQGKYGSPLYIVADGICEVFVNDSSGYVKSVAQLQRGAFFGEMSLLTGDPHTATVRAMGDATLVSINKLIFSAIIQADPKLAEALGKVLVERQNQLAELTGKIVDDTPSSGKMSNRIKSFFRIK